MNAREPIEGITEEKNASKSFVDFLRAIRFPRKAKANNEEPQQHFAGLSSSRQTKAPDEDDCIRSGN